MRLFFSTSSSLRSRKEKAIRKITIAIESLIIKAFHNFLLFQPQVLSLAQTFCRIQILYFLTLCFRAKMEQRLHYNLENKDTLKKLAVLWFKTDSATLSAIFNFLVRKSPSSLLKWNYLFFLRVLVTVLAELSASKVFEFQDSLSKFHVSYHS